MILLIVHWSREVLGGVREVLKRGAVAWGLGVALVLAVPAGAPALAGQVVVVTDVSTSMQGEPLRQLKAGCKLFAVIHNGSVAPVWFSDTAGKGPAFTLDSPAQRRALMAYFDGLTLKGGTNYLAALDLIASFPRGTAVVFVTDGENQVGSPDDVLARVKVAPGPIYTVAVAANPAAKSLLARMATASGGSATAVDDAEGLTRTLVSIAVGLSDYAAYTPDRDSVVFENARPGAWIGLGYNATVTLAAQPSLTDPLFEYEAQLPREHVHVARADVKRSGRVAVRVTARRSPTGRPGSVLRGDLVINRLTTNVVDGKAPAGGSIELVSTPRPTPPPDAGSPPLARPRVAYELREGGGAIRSRAEAAPMTDGSGRSGARLDVPEEPGKSMTLVQVEEYKDGAAKFTRETARDIILEKPQARGLDLPPVKELKLGEHSPGTIVHLGPFPVPTLDAGKFTYHVDVEDLSGPGAALSVSTPSPTIQPTTTAPAAVPLEVDLTGAAAGEYRGRVTLRGPAAGKTWAWIMTLKVVEPIRARLDLPGPLAPGRIVGATLVVANTGSAPLPSVALAAPPVAAGEGSIEFILPGRVTVPPGGQVEVPVKVAVSPLSPAVGRFAAEVRLRRGPNAELRLPVTIELGQGGASDALLVAPRTLKLSGSPGDVVRFRLTVKAASGAQAPDDLRVQAGEFRASDGRPAEVTAHAGGARLSRRTPAVIEGALLAPDAPGNYSGTLVVGSTANGNAPVQVVLQVR